MSAPWCRLRMRSRIIVVSILIESCALLIVIIVTTTMVDLSAGGPDGPLEHGFSDSVFVFPGVITLVLVVFFGYKLYRSLMDKERKREDKKRLKIQKKKK